MIVTLMITGNINYVSYDLNPDWAVSGATHAAQCSIFGPAKAASALAAVLKLDAINTRPGNGKSELIKGTISQSCDWLKNVASCTQCTGTKQREAQGKLFRLITYFSIQKFKIVDLICVDKDVSTLEIIHIEKATGIAIICKRKFYDVLRATGELLKQLQRE